MAAKLEKAGPVVSGKPQRRARKKRKTRQSYAPSTMFSVVTVP